MFGKRTKVFFQDCGPGPDPPFFDCEAAGGDGFYAYDKNCRKYVQCSGGLPDIHTCNPGMFFLKMILKITILKLVHKLYHNEYLN